MTRSDDPRLAGRHPEFSRKSNRPGLGAGAMALLAGQLRTQHGADHVASTQDLPTQLAIGKKKIPIGRYLRDRLRKEMGLEKDWNAEAKKAKQLAESAEMLSLLVSKGGGKGNSTLTTKTLILTEQQGQVWSIKSRLSINEAKKRKPL